MNTQQPFNFFAVLSKKSEQFSIRRLPLSRNVQRELTRKIIDIANGWLNLTTVDFSNDDHINDEEIFSIDNYTINNVFVDAINNSDSTEPLDNENSFKHINAIFSGSSNSSHIFFQNFDKRSAISKSKTALFFSNNTFSKIENELLIFPETLAMIFNISNNQVLFKSFYNANKIVDLSSYSKEASNEELSDFLSSNKIFCKNIEGTINGLDSVSKKRIARIIDEKTLDDRKVTVREIKSVCSRYGLNIKLTTGKINFPSKLKEQKKFIRLLNEDYFESSFTKTSYRANSKRKIN